jgi:hypothetical protein
MKRMHVHMSVVDLEASTRFYTVLFAAEPTVLRSDYAKWMLDDPRVNFAISVGRADRGVHHFGIQVESSGELAEVHDRMLSADRPTIEEASATCCYAVSEKAWVEDPEGFAWETFLTAGEHTEYGGSGPAIGGKVLPPAHSTESAASGLAEPACGCDAPAKAPSLRSSSVFQEFEITG